MSQTDNLQMRYAVYCRIFMAELTAVFVVFLPYLADYYLLQPQSTLLDYFAKNSVDRYYSFEIIIVTLTVAALWCISGRLGVAMIVLSMLFLLLSYAGSIKYAALGELFRLSDLRLTEAAGIATRYLSLQFAPKQLMVMITVLFLCAGGFVSDWLCRKYPLCKRDDERLKKNVYVLRFVSGCVCLAAMIFYGVYFIKSAYSMETVDNAFVSGVGNDRYVLYYFLKNDSMSNIDMEHVDDSYHFFLDTQIADDKTSEKTQFPNVIVIMNESWWNTDNIPDTSITFSSDPMEAYRRLAPNCASGGLTTNLFCGGTIGSETEFLTGLNIKYFTSFTGISTEMEKRKVPSIVDYFKALDYGTVAIHPYDGSFYGRNEIYASMGFDKTVFEDDMYYTDIYSCYISDESLVKQIMKEYGENENDRKFIFAVSIGNHIRGLDSNHNFIENYPYPISVTLNGYLDEEAYTDLVNYVNGIYLANEAFAQLASYFEQKKEPTVLIMYGDHMPGFSKEALSLFKLDGEDLESLSRQYAVPVLMWSNFETKKMELNGENINYLPQIMLEYAGLPESYMTRVLKYQREILRTNTGRIVVDCNGQPVTSYNDEQIEAIRHFKVVDYDILYGSSLFRDGVWQPYGATGISDMTESFTD